MSATRRKKQSAPKINTQMPDGTRYAGISPRTGEPMYTTSMDVEQRSIFGFSRTTFTLEEAFAAASKLDAHGHRDWRVPTKEELNVLFHNRAKTPNFITSSSNPASWYWSSSQHHNDVAWAQRFSDGRQGYNFRGVRLSVRCVRG